MRPSKCPKNQNQKQQIAAIFCLFLCILAKNFIQGGYLVFILAQTAVNGVERLFRKAHHVRIL